jgi:cell division septal protein FtsQ
MVMNTAFDILVIVLSCLLGIFLILSIIAISLVLKLMKSLRQIVARGEQLVDSAEEIGETLRRNAGAAGLMRMLLTFVANISNAKGKRD